MDKKLKIAIGVGAVVSYFWLGHVIDYEVIRPNIARQAREYADSVGKPMINVGCGQTDWGDINVDIEPQNVRNFIQLDVGQHMPFADKQFGALLASHVLEHLEDPDTAFNEWCRIANRVYIAVPSLWNGWGWLTPQHKWVFLGIPQPRIRIPFR